ncbi:unnamed protein product [Lactuca virosa]|uniref:AMP-dependent synthetase/ligase domain-containing protein n=1 Tax=Lactuca virosa TaxID=75947 RepID=A0AAU9PV83_9ASTR|nr:unnamed protein product [Lactuca virosa]
MGLITFTYAQLQRGNTTIVMARFEVETTLDAIQRYKVTHLYTAPPVVVALVKQSAVVRRYNSSSLQEIGTSATPLSKDTMDECSKNFPQEKMLQFNEEARSPFVKKFKTIVHPGEVNRIRELPQNNKIVATHTDSPDVLIWDVEAQPNRHAILGATESRPNPWSHRVASYPFG